jgi:hypothetical protein
MLAMDVNDNACLLDKRVTLRSIASMLAPTCGQRKGYLPMQKLEKIRPSRSSELNAPVISPKAC